MILDALIYKLAFIALIVSCVQRRAIAPAVVLCISLLINELIFIQNPTWQQLESWAILFVIKDVILMMFLYMRQKTTELILGISFAVSCLYHQLMIIEIQNRVLDLKHIRPDVMAVIMSMQLAAIFLIWRGSNGGRRTKHYLHIAHHRVNSIFHSTAQANSK